MAVVGGFGGAHHADPEVAALFESEESRASLAAKLGIEITSVELKEYQTQVVAGLNYKAKLTVNGDRSVIVKAHRPLPHTGAPFAINEAHFGEAL